MISRVALSILVLGMLVFCGCGKRSDDVAIRTEPVHSNACRQVDHDDSPIAIRIDGRDLTRQEVIRNGKVMLTLNMNKGRRTKIGSGDRKFLRSYCRNLAGREIGRAAVSLYLKDQNLAVGSNTLAKVTKAFEKRYGAYSKKLKRWHKIDDLKYMLGKNAFRIDCEIRDLANYEVATNDMIRTAKLQVTDQMVAERVAAIADYNRRMSATNELVFATASNVWHEITGGAISFEDAAAKYSEDVYLADGIEWGSFTKEQLQDEPAVVALLPTLQIGDITPPVESDGGLAILRRDEDDDPDTISFSRIFFRLPLFYEEETLDETRSLLMARQEYELVQRTLEEYASKLKIEYPDGTNVMSAVITAKEFEH